MRIPIEPDDNTGGPFSQLLRLQTDFYSRLTEETLKYIRRIQGTTAPAVPGTVIKPGKNSKLSASGSPGTSTELMLEIENRQRVHCIVTPLLSPMVNTSGVTWFPAAEASPSSILLAPAEIAAIKIDVALPADIPCGDFHGALMLQGFQEGVVAVVISITDGDETSTEDLNGPNGEPSSEAEP